MFGINIKFIDKSLRYDTPSPRQDNNETKSDVVK
jgi:hypothetical protein